MPPTDSVLLQNQLLAALPPADFARWKPQLEAVNLPLGKVLYEAGGTMRDIVKCTVYVTDRANWQPMNEVYFANFTEDPPHRVSCIVSGLGGPECLVEIDATAHLGD